MNINEISIVFNAVQIFLGLPHGKCTLFFKGIAVFALLISVFLIFAACFLIRVFFVSPHKDMLWVTFILGYKRRVACEPNDIILDHSLAFTRIIWATEIRSFLLPVLSVAVILALFTLTQNSYFIFRDLKNEDTLLFFSFLALIYWIEWFVLFPYFVFSWKKKKKVPQQKISISDFSINCSLVAIFWFSITTYFSLGSILVRKSHLRCCQEISWPSEYWVEVERTLTLASGSLGLSPHSATCQHYSLAQVPLNNTRTITL